MNEEISIIPLDDRKGFDKIDEAELVAILGKARLLQNGSRDFGRRLPTQPGVVVSPLERCARAGRSGSQIQ